MRNVLFLVLFSLITVFSSAPANGQTITDIVASSGNGFDRNFFDYDILLKAVVTAELDGVLATEGLDATVFAPNDLAFILTARDLGYDGFREDEAWEHLVKTFSSLAEDGDPIPVLTNVLLYHVAPKKLSPFRVIFSRRIETLLEGAIIRPRLFQLRDNDPDFRDPFLFFPINVKASNGIIHTINRVLIPIDLP